MPRRRRPLSSPRRITWPTGGARRVFRAGLRSSRWTIRALGRAPLSVRVVIIAAFLVSGWAASNWAYHATKKPTELLFPVSDALWKTRAQTWREYGSLFREHATDTITPELLAALAQVEGAGNPLARTDWRWRSSWNPFEWYQPASSAVGMYQITDATFREAKRFCIHAHAVAEAGRWTDLHGCWFNALYTRLAPGDAIEMTAALLDHDVTSLLARHGIRRVTASQQQRLAAVIHLCGAGGGDRFIRRGFTAARWRCGDQDVAAYLDEVTANTRAFAALARKR